MKWKRRIDRARDHHELLASYQLVAPLHVTCSMLPGMAIPMVLEYVLE